VGVPPLDAQWYLPTLVTVRADGVWLSGFEFCIRHHVQIHVITAWNPGDERPSDAINDSQNEQLRLDISALGFECFEALGSDPDSPHAERSWAVIGLADEIAIDLGKKYGQVAVFRITQSRQSVLGCLSDWEVSRGNRTPIGIDHVAEWINETSKRNHAYLQSLLDRYFGKGSEYVGYQGRQFEWFVGQSEKGSFTSEDLLAIGALSVQVPASTARKLIEDENEVFGAIIGRCHVFAEKNQTQEQRDWLWDDKSPFNELHLALNNKSLPGVGKVVRSKLMAAKFPELIPIRDSRVEALLECSGHDEWWKPMHQLLSETQKALSSLEIFNASIEVSLLRKLDVVLWMEASDREVTNARTEVS
jgi:hypothetical protein